MKNRKHRDTIAEQTRRWLDSMPVDVLRRYIEYRSDDYAADWRVLSNWIESQPVETAKAYDTLAPAPNAWPEGAQWYTIDAENQCHWHTNEPSLFNSTWDSNGKDWAGFVDLPKHIDWRDCKWSREAAQ